MMPLYRAAISVILASLYSISAQAGEDGVKLKPKETKYTVKGNLEYVNKKGKTKTAFDLSGIACVTKSEDVHRCLVINDEGSEAQFLKIEGARIEPKKRVLLRSGASGGVPRGSFPTEIGCRGGTSDDGEFDGEGVAYAAPYFYVVGSHCCGRKHDEFKGSAMVLARIRVDDEGKIDGEPEAAVETTFRLGEALAKAGTVGPYALKSLKEQSNGLNLEGVAVIGKRLYAGLRAPSLEGKAYLVSVSIDELFMKEGPFETIEVLPLQVGADAGIRDLALLQASDDRHLLVLTGPAQEQVDVAYKLFIADVKSPAEPKLLGHLDALEDNESCGKAEAVTVIGKNRVLVLFDSLENGGPRAYDVPLGQ